ncbi:right-handed parallel beta-helix repeat-containing protein [Mucilaginibacter auburnensis]|uniref:Parallel beta helix pectate lyase-like protein n=1 Tax=Mucilaginibacter auburnensis TaxID=1457233 RepID=A0A2H9VNT9_9SPHI|nr:right-handed parallel beta-helix repeat-containing protein [Mucilaginibacter auburnensis]PJJ80009.1 parallel beta helix pectate lyase-like protein [Mucilaginibacter auburnensis]
MKRLLIYTLVLLPFWASATKYYVSSAGSDSNNGTSASTPWQSISKVNAGSFAATDSVLFKRGNVFSGSLVATCNIGSYGTGALPVISGFNTVSSWTALGGNLYQSGPLKVGASNTINMVLINGVQQAVGRYPKTSYDAILSANGNSITGSLVGKKFTGGTVVIKTDNYMLEKRIITAQNGSTITYNEATSVSPKKGYGYFIQNAVAACTQQGDWYYDARTQRIVIYSTKSPTFTAQYSAVETPVTLKAANIKISGVRVTGGNSQNIDVQAPNCSAVNVLSDYAHVGIRSASAGFNCINCTVNNVNSTGIMINANNNVIKSSLITNVNMIPGTAATGANGNGVLMRGNNNQFVGDTIRNTGYNGIYAANANIIIKDFAISNFCNVLTDGGGVYVDGAVKGTSGYVGDGICLDGSKNGIAGSAAAKIEVSGVYLDNNASDIEIANVSVFNMPLNGIYLHDGHSLKIHHNTIYNCAVGFALQEDNYSNTIDFYNNSITALKGQRAMAFVYFTDAVHTRTIGRFNNNIYSRPSDDNNTIQVYHFGSNKNTFYNLTTFKTAFALDSNSSTTPPNYVPGSTVYPVYSTAKKTVTQAAAATYQTLTGNRVSKGAVVKAPMNSGMVIYKVGTSASKPIVNN